MKKVVYVKDHKKLNEEKCAEWKRVVFSSLWKLWVVALLAALFLFAFYQPNAECDRMRYFKLFVIRPTFWSGLLLIVAQGLINGLMKKVNQQVLSVCTIVVFSLFAGICVCVHTSVPLMPVLLLFPMTLIPLYRDARMGIFQGICSIAIYIAYRLYFVPHTPYMPPRNSLIDVTIFVTSAIALYVIVEQVNISFILYDEKSSRDSLTHFHNHESFYEELEYYMKSYQQKKAPFSVLIADIDDFKKVNDTYGHAFGDQVIRQVVEAFDLIRGKNDFAARYGGEEFAMILPGRTLKEAAEVGERIRQEFENYAFLTTEGTRHFTLSVGVAEYNKVYENASSFFECADRALYQAKKTGKNKVCCNNGECITDMQKEK